MNSHDLNQRWQIDLTAASVCLFIVAAWYFAVLSPLLGRHGRADALRLQVEELHRNTAAATTSYHASLAQLESLQQSASPGVVQLRPAAYINHQIAAITDLAATSGLEVQGAHVGQATPTDRFLILPIHVEGKGTFQQVLHFLHQLGDTCPATGCNAVRLGSATPSPDTIGKPPTLTFSIELRWFALPASAPVAGGETDRTASVR